MLCAVGASACAASVRPGVDLPEGATELPFRAIAEGLSEGECVTADSNPYRVMVAIKRSSLPADAKIVAEPSG